MYVYIVCIRFEAAMQLEAINFNNICCVFRMYVCRSGADKSRIKAISSCINERLLPPINIAMPKFKHAAGIVRTDRINQFDAN